MDAMIFDFDGVVVDSEPIHLIAFQETLSKIGAKMTREDYYGKYLGFDDHDCLAAALRDNQMDCSEDQITDLIAFKTKIVQKAFTESIEPLPGAVTLIRQAGYAGIPMGICSGALRDEIELAARSVGVLECFGRIVSAEDVARGKPDPQGYQQALEQLSELTGDNLRADRCIVVEDAPAGIQAAKSLQMKVLAVTNSYGRDKLQHADRIVDSLEHVTVDELEELL